MDFGSITKAVGSIKDGVGNAGLNKVGELLDSLNEGLPQIKALGFSVKDFRIGQGAIPEIMIKLVGDIDAIDPDRIQKVIDSVPDQKILVTTLQALQGAASLKDRLSALEFKGVEAEIVLGLPPSVSVNLME